MENKCKMHGDHYFGCLICHGWKTKDRLATSEAVCRAAQEFNNWLEKTELSDNGKEIKIVTLGTYREALRPKINESVKQFKQALAAWEAMCKKEQP